MTSRRELTLGGILPHLVRDDTGWRIAYRGITLRSAFQPVISIAHKRIVGYEALLRATDASGNPIPPAELFARAHSVGAALALERLARCVHFANFAEQNVKTGWLFVNVLPQLFRASWPNPTFIGELCEHFDVPHARIVVEVVEQAADDEALFLRTVDALRERGMLIAVDDFGTGFSNFDRVWRVRPDIVKLDRSLVARMATPGVGHQFATHLVTMLHRAGTMVLGEGVESEDEMFTLIEADIDFVQGFWLGQPHASISTACAAVPALIDSMWARFRSYSGAPPDVALAQAGLEEAVLAGRQTYEATADLTRAAQRILHLPFVRRVFVIDANGEQRQPAIVSRDHTAPPSFAPLSPDTGSNWSQRTYFKEALAAPQHVAFMGPHYSLAEGKDCYTGAVTVEVNGMTEVFCVDFAVDAVDAGSSGK